MKALLVGAGAMGRAWAGNIQSCPGTSLAGWVDIAPDAAARAADELSISDVHVDTDLERAIGEVMPDYVVDVTVPEAHHDVTLCALRHGIPVLGEKPMSSSMETARAMVAASERAGKLYMVSQSRRYDNRLAAYRDLIQSTIGPPGILKSDFYLGIHFGGFRDAMPHVLLLDMAIHTFDAARYLTQSDPVSVYCEEFNPHWSWYAGAASAAALFEMTGNLRYTYSGSWCSEGLPTSWEGEWRAVGAGGTATWDGHGAPRAEFYPQSGTETRSGTVVDADLDPDVPAGIAGSLREFLLALQTGIVPNGECHDNIKSLAMVFAAIESAESGRRVKVEW